MNAELALTGALHFVLHLATVLTAPLAWWLLRRYRRAVLAGMNRTAAAGAAPVAPPAPAAPPSAAPAWPLQVSMLGAAPAPASPAARHARRAPWHAGGVVLAGSLVYALIMAVAYLRSSDNELLPLRTFYVTALHLWPGVLALMLVAVYDWRHRAALLLGYALLLVLPWWLLPPPPQGVLWNVAVPWAITNAAPTLIALLSLWRGVRAVGPLVLAFVLVALIGAQLTLWLLDAHQLVFKAVFDFFFALGFGGVGTFWALQAIGLLAAALLFWPALHAIGRRYEARAFSERQLTLAALFTVFAVAQSSPLAFASPAWFFSGLVALVAAHAVMALLWKRLPPSPQPAARLLLLRVFALGARSERFFARLRRHWQPLAPVTMIAGPDLVEGTVEPHEFLAFLGGRLDRQFVAGAADLGARVARFDPRTAPDGLHRIEELFCRNDTWQMAMQRLADDSAAVLMDLRSFSPDNAGCRWEIGRLLDRVDLRRVVLLVDGTTQLPYLERTLQELWRELAADSPNRHAGATVRLLRLDEPGHAAIGALLGHLLPGDQRLSSA